MDKIKKGLYDEKFEHDACGIGAVISINGTKTHKVVDDALKIVEKLEHRAGKDSAGETGDGVGIMLQVSHSFFSKVAAEKGIDIGNERDYGVGMFFFPQDTLKRNQAKKLLEVIIKREGLNFLFWRKVPVSQEVLGEKARNCMPCIEQLVVGKGEEMETDLDFERKLYVARRVFEQSTDNIYVSSFSCKTIVYKGMFLVGQLRMFYDDLQSEDYKSAIALVHSRFSTNTNPSWERAHPNRFILHNGEINTIRGNIDRMLSREETMMSTVMSDDIDKVLPVVDVSGSDSSMLDNTIEFLVMNGMDLPLAMMIVIPEPWRNVKNMRSAKHDFYEYYSTMMEPWDGPASILYSDGDVVGATLDRNGLRPSRYYITDDDHLILSSEVGVLDIEPEKIVLKSRLQPGKMLLVDTKQGRVIDDEELKKQYATSQPYGEWVDRNLTRLTDLPIPNIRAHTHTQAERDSLYKAFGYAYEDIKSEILPMAQTGHEKTAAMGVDIPLAVLSDKHQPLFNYFKQIFAQVTNPPFDAIREEIVTDTCVYIGSEGNLLEEKADNCNVIQIANPILTNTDMLKIRHMNKPGFKVETISLLYYISTPLERALEQLFVRCDRAYKNGANVIILSDKGVDENHVAIPSLLAVSAVEKHLIRTKKRTSISLIIETGEPRGVHHFATLLGFGARAVNPYLAYEAIEELINLDMLNKDFHVAVNDYNNAILHGIVKIASKMGVSTLQSYQSAQIFEIIGIEEKVVEKYFTNSTSRIQGIGLTEIDEGVKWRHSHAFDPLGLGVDTTLDSTGDHNLRSGEDKDDHLYSPETIVTLQQATREGDYEKFKKYTSIVDSEDVPHTLRGLLTFKYAEDGGIPLDEVESVESIMKRFKTGAMSYGSISQEAHECLAKAMNSVGGKSNSGEGGELPERLQSIDRCSSIKQVASGRFGVTSEYLNSASEIQVKLAQGAKPGEGGHLPGKKVYPWIAKTRYSTPGVSLISPPPHHDIYSIEDLAQLIYDLKNSNTGARISVKLVSECGVGTIAAGVAKAGAEVILISGYDGGTGAAPKSSIHHAGLPWELGVAETHQTLIKNGLRSKVIIEADGKLMSGEDVATAAILGAEEFGFATAPLICMGCVMMRVCDLDTCPVGIATQNPELRKRFKGKPEYVANFMKFVAMQLREVMAKLGVKTVNELVGRTDLIEARSEYITDRVSKVDVSAIIDHPFDTEQPHFNPADIFDFKLEETLDADVLIPHFEPYFKTKKKAKIEAKVTSTNRAVGTMLGSEITKNFGSSLPVSTYTVKLDGGAGQSLGAFIPKGLTIKVEGDSNDYFGKGLSGGRLVIYPPKGSKFMPEENIIIGNVALYGATSGQAYINGIAGERFCVRNSGATAVVEGVGDHGCEYMTGGVVAVLGNVGKNFAAGMSGGVAYVLDAGHDLYLRVNKEMVTIELIKEKYEEDELLALITEHFKETGSPKAEHILENFEYYLGKFKKIVPVDYAKMLQSISTMEEKGMSREQAEIEAFYANI